MLTWFSGIFSPLVHITFTAIYYVCRRAHEKRTLTKKVIKFCYIDIQNRPNGQEKQIQAKETRHHIQKGFCFYLTAMLSYKSATKTS